MFSNLSPVWIVAVLLCVAFWTSEGETLQETEARTKERQEPRLAKEKGLSNKVRVSNPVFFFCGAMLMQLLASSCKLKLANSPVIRNAVQHGRGGNAAQHSCFLLVVVVVLLLGDWSKRMRYNPLEGLAKKLAGQAPLAKLYHSSSSVAYRT